MIIFKLVDNTGEDYSTKSVAYYKIASAPYSADPLEHDADIHHAVFRSVQATLITDYKLSADEFTGILAESWTISPDGLTWRFKIRNGLTFESGSPIDANSVRRSLTRIMFLQKSTSSHSTLVEAIEGTHNIENASSTISGIQAFDSTTLIIKVTRPFPALLHHLAFGVYGIVDSADFDAVTGNWHNPRKLSASGFYQISEWNDRGIKLQLRKQPVLRALSEKPFQNWLISWKEENLPSIDLRGASSFNKSKFAGMSYSAGPRNMILYAQCISWKLQSSACHDLDVRRWVRQEFFRAFNALMGTEAPRTFFPTNMRGITDWSSAEIYSEPSNFKDISAIDDFSSNLTWTKPLKDALRAVKRRDESSVFNTSVPDFQYSRDALYNPDRKEYPADLNVFVTSINIEEPEADINFMVKSKESIRLPDSDGRILKQLNSIPLSAQKISEILWDQAIVWPLMHFSRGLWHSDRIDLSFLNLQKAPIELQWINQK